MNMEGKGSMGWRSGWVLICVREHMDKVGEDWLGVTRDERGLIAWDKG